MKTKIVSPAMVEEYREQGVVFIPQALEPHWLDLIEIGFLRNMRSPGPFASDYAHGHHDGRFFMDFYNYFVNPEYRKVLIESPIADILGDLMGTTDVWLYYEQIFYKGDGDTGPTAWHQDLPTYKMEASDQISGAWISLDPLEAEYALEVIPGSHRGPLYNGINTKDIRESGIDLGQPTLPKIERNRADWNIVSYATQPGDMLVIHPQILHGGAPIPAGRTRRAFTVNVFGPDVKYTPRPISGLGMKFPGLDESLAPGDPLRSDYFPQLRPARPGPGMTAN
jgi:ectoine hydroxylase-related dioxygenase (phytanoyl-CoA dioxygenase family)